jgi:hypothetical protein
MQEFIARQTHIVQLLQQLPNRVGNVVLVNAPHLDRVRVVVAHFVTSRLALNNNF